MEFITFSIYVADSLYETQSEDVIFFGLRYYFHIKNLDLDFIFNEFSDWFNQS